MEPKTEEFLAKLEIRDVEDHHPKSFELYEEYSQTSIEETIRNRREKFNKADVKARKELLAEVENEIGKFCKWLEENKNFEHAIAYYYAVSLKSLLLGLPVGVYVAKLFGAILDNSAIT